MSKEQKRKKKMRLDLRRGSIMVATLASVAVGGVAHAAEEVDSSTQPSTTTAESKPKADGDSSGLIVVRDSHRTDISRPMGDGVTEPTEEVSSPSPKNTEGVSSGSETGSTTPKLESTTHPSSETEGGASGTSSNPSSESNATGVESTPSNTVVEKPKESGTVDSGKPKEEPAPKSDSISNNQPSTEAVSDNNPKTEGTTDAVKPSDSATNTETKPAETSSVESPTTENSAEKPKEDGSVEGSSEKPATENLEGVSEKPSGVASNEGSTETKPVEGVTEKPKEDGSDTVVSEIPAEGGETITEGTSDKPKEEVGTTEGESTTPKEEKPADNSNEKPKEEVGTTEGSTAVSPSPTESNVEKPKEDKPAENATTGGSTGSDTEKPTETGASEKPKEDGKPESPTTEVEKPKEGGKPESPIPEGDGTKPVEDNSNTGDSTGGGSDKPKEDGTSNKPSENGETEKPKEDGKSETPTTEVEKPKEDGKPETPTHDGGAEKPKEELPSNPTKPVEEVPSTTNGNPSLDFTSEGSEGFIKKTGSTYTLNTSSRQPILVKVPEGVSPKSVKIYQNLANGSVREINGARGELYPVSSTITVTYTDEKGEEVTKEVGKIVDTATNAVVAKGSDRKLSLSITPAVIGDSLPSTLTLTTEDGKHTLTGVLKDGSYSFDSSNLPEGEYDFKIAEGETTAYGRKFMSEIYHMKGKEVVKPVEPQPNPIPEPTPTPAPEVPSVPSVPSVPDVPETPAPVVPSVPSVDVPVAPAVEVKPLTPSKPVEKPSAEKPTTEAEKPNVEKPKADSSVKPVEKPSVEAPRGEVDSPRVVTPTVVPTVSDHTVNPVTPTPAPVPSFVEQPSYTKPQGTPSTDVSNVNATIITPTKPVETNNTNGNTNTNSSNINIGGISNQANYTENPNRLTVDVNSGSVREVKATVSSQEGTTELQGRVVNGSFVADKLPEKDGVYTVKVQVTDDKGQVSEKTITYAVNKNGSTYDWLSKGVNGSYYQRLTEDLKLSEHSTTQLDTSKTKFTFTLDGKVITVDASQVQVNEKKEDDGSYTYTYTFNKGAFKENGVWSISVATVDVDGHASSSNASVQFQFVLDNIVPELKIEGIANNNQYNSAKHQFRVLVKDNIGLAKVLVKINGKVYEFTKEELLKGEKVLDLAHSSKPYTIKVEVTDLAGNTTNQTVEGITVSATDIQALLESDNIKIALGIFGTAAFGGLLTWWALAVRNRKRREEELERYRVGAHLVTEAEGLASSNGSGSVEHTDIQGGSHVAEEAGFVAAEVLGSVKDTGSLTNPVSTPSSEGETTETLPLDGETSSMTEVLDSDEVEEATTVLSEDEEEAVAEKTTILEEVEEEPTEVLDSEEHTTVLEEEDLTEPNEVLDSEEESTEILELEESTEVLDSDEHTTVLEEEVSEPIEVSEEHTSILEEDSTESTEVLEEASTEVLDTDEKTTVLDVEDEELAEKTTILDEVDEDTEILD